MTGKHFFVSSHTSNKKPYDWNDVFNNWRGAIAVGMDFFFRHPKGHYTANGGKSKRYCDIYTQAPDADKLARAVFDALTGTVYPDDNRAIIEHAAKWYGVEGVIVTIYFVKEKINALGI